MSGELQPSKLPLDALRDLSEPLQFLLETNVVGRQCEIVFHLQRRQVTMDLIAKTFLVDVEIFQVR